MPRGYNGEDLEVMERPYPWQRFVIDTITSGPADDRTVHWIYDPAGNKGKSKLVKFLAWKKLAKCLVLDTASRLTSAICIQGAEDAYVIDIPRTICKDKSVTSVMQVIEGLKNGNVSDNMYGRNNEMMMLPPHVFVFANHPPPRDMLSLDRWKVYKLTEDYDMRIEEAPPEDGPHPGAPVDDGVGVRFY